MPRFATQFDDHARVYADPGSRLKAVFSPFFNDNGVMYLKETGTHDLYAEIQSHAGSVDIHEILRRFAAGDTGALARAQGAYGDFTSMPKTFAEALNTMIAAEQYFLGLPVETRARFGHDFHRFVASFDSPEFAAAFTLGSSDVTPDVSASPGTQPSVSVASSASPSPASVSPSPAPNPSSGA